MNDERTQRPDIIGMATEAGGWDRAAFEAGYALRVQADLLGAVAGAQSIAQVVTRPEFVASLQALASHVNGKVSLADPDNDTDEAVLVLLDFTPGGAS